MSGLLASVDQRTNLVGENRLELLMFKLKGRQTYAINVFKVQEVLQLPNLTAIPDSHPCICGVTHYRGQTLPVINLSQAIGLGAIEPSKESIVIVTEYNRSVQAFLVGGIERIANMNWKEISAPPKPAGKEHYLTAITNFDNQIVEVIDVEKILAEITPYTDDVSDEYIDPALVKGFKDKFIMVVDDSQVAIAQAEGTIKKIGFNVITASNGMNAFQMLTNWAENNQAQLDNCLMVLTDAEMPEMDGYRLTTEIRAHECLKHLHIVMHTSLSGSFNKAMAQRVGCDHLLSKFQPDELAAVVVERAKSLS